MIKWKAPRLLIATLFFSIAGLAALVAPAAKHAQSTQVKRVYIALDDHTDYMWAANQETYRQAFLEMIDFYLDQADATASQVGLSSHQQSRFNCDGSFWMWVYEKHKPAKDFERFIQRVRSGHLTVPLTGLISTYGGTPAEAILRSMYYIVRGPAHGTLSGDNNDRYYAPRAGFTGTDRFTWRVNDGKADSKVAAVTITVAARGADPKY